MTFFNTINLHGKPLYEAEVKTRTQEERVHDFFLNAGGLHGPTEVMDKVFHGENVPVTSVRRAITNLTSEGKLTKSISQCQGAYGKPEYLWRLPAPVQRKLF